jgi:hypothetical protein
MFQKYGRRCLITSHVIYTQSMPPPPPFLLADLAVNVAEQAKPHHILGTAPGLALRRGIQEIPDLLDTPLWLEHIDAMAYFRIHL